MSIIKSQLEDASDLQTIINRAHYSALTECLPGNYISLLQTSYLSTCQEPKKTPGVMSMTLKIL